MGEPIGTAWKAAGGAYLISVTKQGWPAQSDLARGAANKNIGLHYLKMVVAFFRD